MSMLDLSLQIHLSRHFGLQVTFSSFVTRENAKINHHFDCKCFIYLVSCNVCDKQYVGSSTKILTFQYISISTIYAKLRGKITLKIIFINTF